MNKLIKGLALATGVLYCAPQMSAAETETWKSLGMGKYRENFLHAFFYINQYPEVDVEIQESEQTPGRYRIVNPYVNFPDMIGGPGTLEGDHYMVIDASDPKHVYLEFSRTGYIAGQDQEMFVWSKADDYYNNLHGNWELADEEGICGVLKDGEITFPGGGLLTTLYDLTSTEPLPDMAEMMWKPCNTNDMFRVVLPGAPDFDVTIEAPTINEAHTMLSYNITLGKSAEKARVALIPGQWSEENRQSIINGTTEYVEITSGGAVAIPYTGDGVYTIYVVPYMDGTPRKSAYLTHEISYDEREWRKCGTAMFYEGIFSASELSNPQYQTLVVDECEYPVEVEECVATPGRIRLVDPYGPEIYRYSSVDTYDTTCRHYLVINGSDPNHVYVEKCEDLGINFNGFGTTIVWSRAGRSVEQGEPFDDIVKANTFGKYENNTFTFPENSMLIYFPDVHPAWWWANNKGKFKVTLGPNQIQGGSNAIDGIANDNDVNAPERWYTADGIEVAADTTTPGIYVIVKGNRTYKRIVK